MNESPERASAALANVGFQLPPRRTTVNLAPSDVTKTGTAFDLAIVARENHRGVRLAERVGFHPVRQQRFTWSGTDEDLRELGRARRTG